MRAAYDRTILDPLRHATLASYAPVGGGIPYRIKTISRSFAARSLPRSIRPAISLTAAVPAAPILSRLSRKYLAWL